MVRVRLSVKSRVRFTIIRIEGEHCYFSYIELSKVEHPSKHIIGHIWDCVLRNKDPTNSVKALCIRTKEVIG